MISTRKWALVLCLVLSCLRYSNAQDITGNLIYSTYANPPPPGSVYSWSGFTITESGGGGLSGGNVPAYNPYVGQFMFGYMPGTFNYSMAISSALSGTGLRVTGIEYGLEYFNQDFSRGSLSTTWTLRDASGKLLESYYHAFGSTTEGWTRFDQTKTFSTPYSLASLGTLGFSATGTDDRFWAGYYGPQFRNPYARLNYGPDLCETNPLSSTTCSGFAAALASRTVVPATTSSEPVVTATTTTTTTSAPTATTAAVTTTSAPAVSIAGSNSTRSSTSSQSSQTAVRVDAIVRLVTESTAATVSATVQASQEQAQAQEQAAAQQAESQSQQSQQMAASLTVNTAASRGAASDIGSDNPAGAFTRPGDPAAAARGLAPVVTSEPPQESRPQPRTIQPPAELAGGPSVTAFQTSVDITAYTNLALRDAQFYAPREIYRGQQTVDNRQALRGLGSDRRHQEMVEQQYRR